MRDETMEMILRAAILREAENLRFTAKTREGLNGMHGYAMMHPDELRRLADLLEWRAASK
jgi:hypothetical protein